MYAIPGCGHGDKSDVGVRIEDASPFENADTPSPAANDPPLDPIRHLDLVHRVARRIARTLPAHVAYDDLVGAGTVGLLEAAARFDPSKGQFAAFAEFRIKGAIMDELRRHDPMGRNARLRRKRLDRAHARLTGELGRPPREDELAERFGISVTDLRRLEQTSTKVVMRSLDQESDANGRSQPLELVAPEASAYHTLAHEQLRDRLNTALADLSERRRRIVEMYYQEELTLKQIGLRVGISESRVCQILGESTRKLKTALKAQGITALVA